MQAREKRRLSRQTDSLGLGQDTEDDEESEHSQRNRDDVLANTLPTVPEAEAVSRSTGIVRAPAESSERSEPSDSIRQGDNSSSVKNHVLPEPSKKVPMRSSQSQINIAVDGPVAFSLDSVGQCTGKLAFESDDIASQLEMLIEADSKTVQFHPLVPSKEEQRGSDSTPPALAGKPEPLAPKSTPQDALQSFSSMVFGFGKAAFSGVSAPGTSSAMHSGTKMAVTSGNAASLDAQGSGVLDDVGIFADRAGFLSRSDQHGVVVAKSDFDANEDREARDLTSASPAAWIASHGERLVQSATMQVSAASQQPESSDLFGQASPFGIDIGALPQSVQTQHPEASSKDHDERLSQSGAAELPASSLGQIGIGA